MPLMTGRLSSAAHTDPDQRGGDRPWSAGSSVAQGPRRQCHTLQRQQLALDLKELVPAAEQVAAIATDRSVARDDPMARDREADRIPSDRAADRPGGAPASDRPG